MTDIVERLREHARVGDGWTRPDAAEAADEIERLRDIEAAYDLNQANSYRAIMMWEEAHSKRASGIHEVELLTWLLDEVERLRAALGEMVTTFHDAGCHVCGGDCASANPPVGGCPFGVIQRARALLLEGGP